MIVVKFGGTSVANTNRIRRAAALLQERYLSKKEPIVVVVSAMAGVTDTLGRYVNEMALSCPDIEQDVVFSAGEPISTALMAMALQNLGYDARSFLGWQVPIITDTTIRNAHIYDIPVRNITNCLNLGVIPVVCGFQGFSIGIPCVGWEGLF